MEIGDKKCSQEISDTDMSSRIKAHLWKTQIGHHKIEHKIKNQIFKFTEKSKKNSEKKF